VFDVGDPQPFEVDDLVVLLLGGPSRSPSVVGKIEGITRLEKLIFLLQQDDDFSSLLTEDAEFVAHNFGPFSSKVYQALDVLAAAGLVLDSSNTSESSDETWELQEVIGVTPGDQYATRDIELTEVGKKYYNALIAELPAGTERRIRSFKDRFALLPLRQLVRFVYMEYPAFTENSLIRDEILGAR
jgi:hypothetical protein